jgi:hypothetical protein
MADTANKSGGSPSGTENPTAAQKLLDDGPPASGITEFQPAPSSDPGWEGNEVLAARVIFKASPGTDCTNNPIHSSKADPIPPEDDSSVSGHSHAYDSQVSRRSHRTPTQSEADALSEIGRLTDDEEQEEARSHKGKHKRNGRGEMNAPRGRKSGGSMTSQNMARLSAEHAYSERVAARFFTRQRESNTYRVKQRDGLIFDNGTHYKKGAYLSENSAIVAPRLAILA